MNSGHPMVKGLVCVIWTCALTLAVMVPVARAGEPGDANRMALYPAKVERILLGGVVGDRVQANIDAWLLSAPLANPGMIEMFRVRDRKPVPELVPWAGEFIGKYLISAIQARRMTGDDRLDSFLREVIPEFISTQAEDGYLGPFRKEERLLGHWDLWGHYHAILALLMWYEDTGDPAALACARRAGDLICSVYLNTNRRPKQAGADEMNLAIIHGLGRLYRATGEDRYLAMMRTVEEDWQETGDYFRQGLAGVPFFRTPRPRWESLHDLQGLVELYRITGNEDYKTAFVQLWRSIAAHDRHNTGGFTTDEAAIGNPYTPGAIETCCTTAWSALTLDMLLLTGESQAADELEWSLYNSILGSQHPTGRWWTYNTPMDGKREASAHAIVFQSRAGTPELNCCSVNAPRGLGMISEWALLSDASGALIVNYYGPMSAGIMLQDAGKVAVNVESAYPSEASATIVLGLDAPVAFPVRLRIPGWSKHTTVTVAGDVLEEIEPGSYLTIERTWSDSDRIELTFDFSIRTWVGDLDQAERVSLFSGPVLLAFDQRDNPYDCNELAALDFSHLSYTRIADNSRFSWMPLFEFKDVNGRAVRLRDFASAGATGTEYRSWLPAKNTPPPPFQLLEPAPQAAIPAGPFKFTWTGTHGGGAQTYTVEIRNAEGASIWQSEPTRQPWCVVRAELAPRTPYTWRVFSQNANGRIFNAEGLRHFVVDPDMPNRFVDHPALLSFRDDGLAAGGPLDGDGTPEYGYLDETRGITSGTDRKGRDGGAVRFAGNGMLRYRIPYFPAEHCSFLAWVCPDVLPEAGLSQVFSAWSRSGDDPLRVVIEGGQIYARIEGSGGANTKGQPLTAGEWVHIAAVKDGARLRLYCNGTLVDDTAAPAKLVTTAEDFALGANPHFSGTENFTGRIDDFAFYARALSEAEIHKMMKP